MSRITSTRQLPVVYIGVAFLLIFFSFNSLQVLLPHDRPSAGPLLIGLTYIGYAFGSLLAPRGQDSQSRRWTFFLASLAFPLWDIALLLGDDLAISSASLAVGIASGILWAVQGSWMGTLAKRDPSKSGMMNGLFMLLYSSSTLFGQLLSATIVDQSSIKMQFIYQFSGIGLAIFASLMLLATPSYWLADAIVYQIDLEDFNIVTEENRVDFSWLCRMKRLWKSPWRNLLPRIVVLSTVTSFIWIAVPLLIAEIQSLNWIFVIYSSASLIAYFTTGYILDTSIPHKWLWSGILVILPVIYNLEWLSPNRQWEFYTSVVGILFLAVLNSTCNNLITIAQTRDLPQEITTDAVAVQHFVYCLGYALCAAGYSLWGTLIVSETASLICLLALVLLFV